MGGSLRFLTWWWWQQQDLHALALVDVPNFAAEPEARVEVPAEAQGAVGPAPCRAGGDHEGGNAAVPPAVPLQQLLLEPPAQGRGWLGLGGAFAVQTLSLPGAEGTQQL